MTETGPPAGHGSWPSRLQSRAAAGDLGLSLSLARAGSPRDFVCASTGAQRRTCPHAAGPAVRSADLPGRRPAGRACRQPPRKALVDVGASRLGASSRPAAGRRARSRAAAQAGSGWQRSGRRSGSRSGTPLLGSARPRSRGPSGPVALPRYPSIDGTFDTVAGPVAGCSVTGRHLCPQRDPCRRLAPRLSGPSRRSDAMKYFPPGHPESIDAGQVPRRPDPCYG